MLVLSRKEMESLVIGGQIVVTVVEIKGGKVRLSIEAPGEVSVHRREVYAKIRTLESSGSTTSSYRVCGA
jgi:carbon storage regulator